MLWSSYLRASNLMKIYWITCTFYFKANGLVNRFNARFAVEAEDKDHISGAAPGKDSLNSIYALKCRGKPPNGSSIFSKGKIYQLVDQRGSIVPLKPRSTVYVTRHLDGFLGAMYADDYFELKPLTNTKNQKVPQEKTPRRQSHEKTINPLWVNF